MRQKITTYISFLVLIHSYCSFYAQQGDKNDYYFRASYHYGFIMQQHNNMGDLVNGYISGVEVNYVKPTTGNKLWHYENNFPEKGVGFSYYNLDNPKQLGNLYALFCFYDIPLNEKPKPFRLYMRLSPGIAYTPVHFDPIENHKNNVTSSTFDANVNFKWYYRWNISPRWRWEGGLNFTHASNGRFKVPNLGLNLVTLNTSLVYKILSKENTPVTKIDSSMKAPSKNELVVWGALGINEVDPPLGKKYLAQSYSVSYYRNVRNTHKFGGGVDIYYNAANAELLYLQGNPITNKMQNVQAGVKFNYAYNVGRMSFPVEMGVYLLTRFKDDGMFFHRIGMRYYFKNNVIALVSLKTHWAVANYFEFGAGYRIPLKKKTHATTD